MLRLCFLNAICHNSGHVSIGLDYLQGVTEHQSSIYKNKDGLLNTLKFVHKIFVGIIKFVCCSAELVHKMQKL
jgi:hypothetical protein